MENIKIKSKADGLVLDVLMIAPKGDIKGIVQISHGMEEHKGRYVPFMQFLAENGYVAVIHDHRGHGQSVNSKEDLGYFYEEKAEAVVEDLHQVAMFIKEKYPDKNLTLLGHSMGSMIVRKYMKKYDDLVDKVIICGSPSRNSFVDLGLFGIKIMKIFRGERYRSEFCQNLFLGKKAKKNEWICADEGVVSKFDDDELCGFTFTLNGFQNLLYLMKDIYSRNGWQVKNQDLPILFIAGADDRIIVSEKKWLESQEFLRSLGYESVDKILYSGMRHEVLNEKNKDVVWMDIHKWIEKE